MMVLTARKWIPLIAAIALVLVACGPGDTTPEPSNVSGWPIYRSEKYGFELRYPPDGRLTEDPSGEWARIELSFAPGTNLVEKYLEITARGKPGEECSSPLLEGFEPGIILVEQVEVSGIEFAKAEFVEGLLVPFTRRRASGPPVEIFAFPLALFCTPPIH